MAEPRLMFCVGATKAGTSWLHRYISDHPECSMQPIKELHYFDAIDRNDWAFQRKVIEGRRAGLQADLAGASGPWADDLRRQIAQMDRWLTVLATEREDIPAYLGYLADGAEGRLVADMTPAYSLLSQERLAGMARLTPDVRFIYLMRDPVARLWSHVRMMAERRPKAGETLAERAKKILNRVINGKEPQIAERSDYRAALGKILAAVAPAQRLVMFYEDLFSQAGVGRICAFLGLTPVPARLERRVFEGQAVPMTEFQRRRAGRWLAEQYDFVATTLGDVPPAWRANMEWA